MLRCPSACKNPSWGKEKVSLLEMYPRFLRDTVCVYGLYAQNALQGIVGERTRVVQFTTYYLESLHVNYEVERQRHNKQVNYTQDSS